jgi:hypothetical protein
MMPKRLLYLIETLKFQKQQKAKAEENQQEQDEKTVSEKISLSMRPAKTALTQSQQQF